MSNPCTCEDFPVTTAGPFGDLAAFAATLAVLGRRLLAEVICPAMRLHRFRLLHRRMLDDVLGADRAADPGRK